MVVSLVFKFVIDTFGKRAAFVCNDRFRCNGVALEYLGGDRAYLNIGIVHVTAYDSKVLPYASGNMIAADDARRLSGEDVVSIFDLEVFGWKDAFGVIFVDNPE